MFERILADMQQQKDKGERVINMINPELTSIKKNIYIYNLTKTCLVLKYKFNQSEVITFTNEELENNEEAKITPIVLKVGMTREEIDKCAVKRVLVDTRATKNTMYLKCFDEMGLKDEHLKPRKMVLEGLTPHKVSVKGMVKIQVTLGEGDRARTEVIKFYVVDLESPYNIIVGTLFHVAFDLVISTSHQQVKFNTSRGVGLVKSSPGVYWVKL